MASPIRKLTIPILGNTSDLEAALTRAGIVAEDASKKITGSFRQAGAAAAEEARKIGASMDEQAAAAGRAAAVFTDMSAKITTAQRNAGKAAAAAASQVGASVDEQRAAYTRAIATQAEYEKAQQAAADAAKRAAAEQAAAVKRSVAESAAAVREGNKHLATVGKWTLLGGLGAGILSARDAAELQKRNMLLHTQAGATMAQMRQLQSGELGMAGSVGTGPNALSDAMFHVVSSLNKTTPAAQRVATELRVLRIAAEGAKTGNANLVDVTNALDAAIVSGIKGVSNYSQAMGVLNATTGTGDMTMQNLADALSTGLLASAKTAGLGIKDVGAALAVFGDNNMRGAMAATRLRMALMMMAAPSQAATKWLKAIGMTSTQMGQDMRSGGLIKALEDLKAHLVASGATASQQAMILARVFGGGRTSSGVLTLLDQLDRLKASYKTLGQGAHSFGGDWKSTTHNLSFQFDQLKATVQALGDKFGMFLIPRLEAVGKATENVIGWFERHKAAATALAAVITGVLGTAVAAFVYQRAVAFVGATANMVSGLGTMAVRVANVIPGVNIRLASMGTTAATTATEVETADAAIVTSADTTAAGVDAALGSTGVGAIIVGLGIGAMELATHWTDALNAVKSVTQSVLNDVVIPALNSMISLLNKLSLGLFHIGSIGNASLTGGGLNQRLSNWNKSYAQNFLNSPLGPYNPATGGRGGFGALNTGGNTLQNAPSFLAGSPKSSYTQTTFAVAALRQLGITPTAQNIRDFTAWEQAEGGNWNNTAKYNPLNTTMREAGSTVMAGGSSAGVQSYKSWAQGLAATVATLKHYGTILAALEHGVSVGQFSSVVAASPWGTGPFSTSGIGVSSGALNALLSSGGASSRAKNIRSLLYANPLPGMTSVGRTDMGVDYSATPGSAVDAIGAGIVTSIIQNWYKGQPLIEERLTQGPNKGKYVYYAEQLKSLVQIGQKVAAGQRIGTVAASGTGLELGFGAPGGKTLAQATTGYTEGQVTPAGAAFRKWMQAIGAHGIYQTVNGTTGAITGGGQNMSYTIQQLTAAIAKAARTAADSLLTRYGNVEQSGTLRTITSALGLHTGQIGFTGHGAGWALGTHSIATLMRSVIEHLGSGASLGQIGKGLSPLVQQATAGSPQEAKFQQAVEALIASGQKSLAEKLVAAHKAAMRAAAQEEYAQQSLKDGELLSQQATHLADQTKVVQDAAATRLQIAKDEQTIVNDQAAQVVQSMRDMQQTVDDRMAGMVQAVKDASTVNTDQASLIVSAIQDQTQIQVDQIGERGKYGLALIAQRLQVQEDITKAYWDQQIGAAQKQLDVLTQQANAAENLARINVDQVTAQNDLIVSQAQVRLDTVTMVQNQRVAAAQAHADAVQLSVDTTKIGPAQIAVDLHANAPKSQQDVYAAQLKKATGEAAVQTARANQSLAQIQGTANAAIQSATAQYNNASNAAQQQIQSASDTLKNITNYYNLALAQQGQVLSGLQGQAAISEAEAAGAVSVAGANAQTQFAGSGIVINQYGVPMDSATQVGEAVSWAFRTQFQTA